MPTPIVCPACNKANQTAPTCQRCGCELSPLHEIAAAAASRLSAARSALAMSNWPAALHAAAHSWRLRHTAESARVAFLAIAAAGDTMQAMRWRRRAEVAEPM